MGIGKKIQLLLFALCLLLPFAAQAQPDTWAISFGSAVQDNPEDIIVDDNGNVYVSGFFRDTLWIGATELIAAGQTDVFLAKFNVNGQLVWAKRYGWFANEFAHGLCFDNYGNVLMVGEYQDSTIFEQDTIYSMDTLWFGPPAQTYDIFWIRVNPDGDLLKSYADGWFGSENFYEVVVSSRDLYYFAGMWRTHNTWVQGQWGHGYDESIWVRSDTNGWMDKKATAGGKYVDRGRALDLIGDSLVILGGTFQDTCFFRDSTVYAVTGFEDDIFVSCHSDTAIFKWVVTGGGPGTDQLNGLVTDPSGNIYICGAYDSLFTLGGSTLTGAGLLDGYLAKLDINGSLLWMKSLGGTAFDLAKDIRLGDNGDVYVTGYFGGNMDLGGTMLTGWDTNDVQNVYVARYDSNGNLIWAKSLGGRDQDAGYAVDVDAAGYVYVYGSFNGSGQFGQVNLTSNGAEDFFLIRMNPDGAVFSQDPNPVPQSLVKAFPNPTKGDFSIQFELLRSHQVEIAVLDLQGRELRNKNVGRMQAGSHLVSVETEGLSPGMYIYRLKTADGSATGKVVISR